MKRLALLVLSVCLVVICTACSSNDDIVPAFRSVESQHGIGYAQIVKTLTLEDAVSISDSVMIGKFVRYEPNDGFDELHFVVDEVIKGNVAEQEEISVLSIPTNLVDSEVNADGTIKFKYEEYNFVEGNLYLLITTCENSVYLEHDRYRLLGNIFVSLDGRVEPYMQFDKLINRVENKDLADNIATNAANPCETILEYVKQLCKTSESIVEEPKLSYTTSTDLLEIVDLSEYVLKIKVEKIHSHSRTENTDQCICSVADVLKSDLNVPSGQIYIKFIGGTVSEGDYLYVCLNRVEPDSDVFTLSSKNSVYSSEDPAFETWINKER